MLPVFSQDSIVIPIKVINNNAFVSEYDIRTMLPVQSTFDIVLQRGRIVNRERYALYHVGLAIALVNDSLVRSDYPVMRQHGEVMIPLDIAVPMLTALLPEYEVDVTVNAITIKKIPTHVKEKEKKTPVTKVSKDAIGFIVVDAGHGGKDPGAIGKGGIKEKHITLQIAKEVKLVLQQRLPGIEVILTRTTDRFIELGERTEIANTMLKKGVNGLFISIHCNAAVVSKISGFETYYLSQNPSNEEARTTSVLENNVIIFENPEKRKRYGDVEMIEALMITTQIQKESAMLAASVQRYLDKTIHEFKSKGVKKADFFVLRGCLMPSVLVEVGYITNPKEKKYLIDKNYQKRLAQGITAGIVAFINEYNRNIANY
jgi:N-acetylmuramoyl-L-alanine amidase